MASYRIGIDVGGTFTDFVCLEAGHLTTRKLPSTPGDFSIATIEGVKKMLAEKGIKGSDVAEVIHGTTVATNAILEKKGANVGIITTWGFRDVLEIGRLRMPKLYDLNWQKPKPLVERRFILEVTERVSSTGEVLVPLNVKEAEAVLERLLSLRVESIVVCFINSFVNPVNEQRMGELISSCAPALTLSLSCEVLPEIREFERMGSTVINAYVKPMVSAYLKTLEKELKTLGIDIPLLIMQSGGGLMSSLSAREKPVNMIESGPAAGVMGSVYLSKQTGRRNIISFDMGGTTAKVSNIEDGEVSRTSEYEVGGEMSMGHHMQKGSGYLLRVPSIELAEVGSGGGSIAWIDQGGALRVGPHSAGASPGPACYGIGGTEPTITDANVVLGYLNPNFLVGGELPLDALRARQAIEEKVAKPLGIKVEEAAYNIHLIANATMIRAIRAVTSEKGRDPGDFDLFAFGGSGPVHASGIAQELDIQEVLVPPAAGVFGSIGLLSADVEHRYVQTYCCDTENMSMEEANRRLHSLNTEGLNDLTGEGYPRDRIQLLRFVDMRYAGQNYELTVPLPAEELTLEVLEELKEAFSKEHERTFGYRSDEHVWLVNLRLVAKGLPLEPRMPPSIQPRERQLSHAGNRQAYFGPENSWLDTPVLTRDALKGNSHSGPIIVEEYNSTTVVPPAAVVSLDAWGNIIIKAGHK